MGNLAPSSSLSLSFSFSSRTATGSRFSFSLSAATTFSLFSFSRRAQSYFLPSFPSQEHTLSFSFPSREGKERRKKNIEGKREKKGTSLQKTLLNPRPFKLPPLPLSPPCSAPRPICSVRSRTPLVMAAAARASAATRARLFAGGSSSLSSRRSPPSFPSCSALGARGACAPPSSLSRRRGAHRLRFPFVPRS